MQDKDAWRKNTAQQLKETRERMQKLSENQLETLTKRTILENEAMAAELKYQSRQVLIPFIYYTFVTMLSIHMHT